MQRIPEAEYMDDPAEADAYARADFREVNAAFVDRLIDQAGHLSAPRALDLGTGPGEIPLLVLAARADWRITAVDASQAMLDHAAARDPRRTVEWVLADAKSLPLPDGGADVVFSNSILHHLPELDALWRELDRVTRDGAVVLLRDLRRPDSQAQADRLVEAYAGAESPLLREEFRRSLLSAFTSGELREQIESAPARLRGLRVEEVGDRHLDVAGIVGE
jgi:SAM-dependent methyltransferase